MDAKITLHFIIYMKKIWWFIIIFLFGGVFYYRDMKRIFIEYDISLSDPKGRFIVILGVVVGTVAVPTLIFLEKKWAQYTRSRGKTSKFWKLIAPKEENIDPVATIKFIKEDFSRSNKRGILIVFCGGVIAALVGLFFYLHTLSSY